MIQPRWRSLQCTGSCSRRAAKWGYGSSLTSGASRSTERVPSLMGPILPTDRLKRQERSEPQRAAGDLEHDLVRAAVDALHAGVAPQARDRVLVHVAVAAEELHAMVEHVELQVRGQGLRARR